LPHWEKNPLQMGRIGLAEHSLLFYNPAPHLGLGVRPFPLGLLPRKRLPFCKQCLFQSSIFSCSEGGDFFFSGASPFRTPPRFGLSLLLSPPRGRLGSLSPCGSLPSKKRPSPFGMGVESVTKRKSCPRYRGFLDTHVSFLAVLEDRILARLGSFSYGFFSSLPRWAHLSFFHKLLDACLR